MGITLLVRPVDQQQRQLSVRFYPKWYCAMSGVDVLAWIFSLASNKHIVHENANVKACQYQEIVSNDLFKDINEQHIYSKVFYN